MSLKYLFQANFADGTFIQQNQEDCSVTGVGSTYTDVLARTPGPISFGLFSDEVPDTYAVDLTDGHFEINGLPFTVQDPSVKMIDNEHVFRLIYFRNVTRNFNAANLEETSVQIVYHIGWQMTDSAGKNHQYTIAIR